MTKTRRNRARRAPLAVVALAILTSGTAWAQVVSGGENTTEVSGIAATPTPFLQGGALSGIEIWRAPHMACGINTEGRAVASSSDELGGETIGNEFWFGDEFTEHSTPGSQLSGCLTQEASHTRTSRRLEVRRTDEYVTGLEVCLNENSDPDLVTVQGVRLHVARWDGRALVSMPDDSVQWNSELCQRWQRRVDCDAGTIAKNVVLHGRGGWLRGLAMNCERITADGRPTRTRASRTPSTALTPSSTSGRPL